VSAPQRDGRDIYVVFKAEEFSQNYAGPGKAKGHFVLVSSDGTLLPVFQNANVLDESGTLFEYAGDGRLALALVYDREGMQQTLHIVPVERKPRSLLGVTVGPPGRMVPTGEIRRSGESTCSGDVCRGVSEERIQVSVYPWTWRFGGSSRSPRIELGPPEALAKGRPRAVYKWSPGVGGYVGPSGSPELGFLRLAPDDDCSTSVPCRRPPNE